MIYNVPLKNFRCGTRFLPMQVILPLVQPGEQNVRPTRGGAQACTGSEHRGGEETQTYKHAITQTPKTQPIQQPTCISRRNLERRSAQTLKRTQYSQGLRIPVQNAVPVYMYRSEHHLRCFQESPESDCSSGRR